MKQASEMTKTNEQGSTVFQLVVRLRLVITSRQYNLTLHACYLLIPRAIFLPKLQKSYIFESER